MRISFLFVTVSHVPFIFFAAKECFLSIVDEIHRAKISTALKLRLQNYTVVK